MKPIVKKLLESGLVDKGIARLMEKWGHLDIGASDLVPLQTAAKEALEILVDDIAELLEDEDEEQEFRLDMCGEFVQVEWALLNSFRAASGFLMSTAALKTPIGSFIFPPHQQPFVQVGNRFRLVSEGGKELTIERVSTLIGSGDGDAKLFGLEVEVTE